MPAVRGALFMCNQLQRGSLFAGLPRMDAQLSIYGCTPSVLVATRTQREPKASACSSEGGQRVEVRAPWRGL